MEPTKFKIKMLELIKKSLPNQKLQKILKPLEVIENRGRYFLVKCQNGKTKKRLVFLRYEKWFFYLHGLGNIPKDFKRREYNYIERNQGPKPNLEAQRKREESEQNKIDKAEKLLASIKLSRKKKKIVRRAS